MSQTTVCQCNYFTTSVTVLYELPLVTMVTVLSITGNNNGHSGIAGPWTYVLDPEMLDSGPIFLEISAQNTQKLLHTCINFGPVCFTP